MTSKFKYDVFLSHNSEDKLRVRQLADRMKHEGLSVWFDEWIIQPGDDIYMAIEQGIEASRALVLCMSPAAFGSDWVGLERSTVVFRDPANRDRRFIPVLLSDCNIPDTLRRYSYVDWRAADESQLERLLNACASPGGSEVTTDAGIHAATAGSHSSISEPSLDEFLDAIGLQHSIGQREDRYAHLDQLFVPPAEFPAILKLLDTNNFVLLLGDPQIGKTYTALNLLYQYYRQGYRPFWESVRDLETTYGAAFQRLKRPRFDLDDFVHRRLDDRNVIYIEDPWGKIQFDMPEEFTSSLEALINRVRASEAKLIITSRSVIFSRLTDLIGKKFAVTLRAEMVYGGEHHSYGDGERARLFNNYYHLFHGSDEGCSAAAKVVLSDLHSPNSIREFCYLTRNSRSADQYKQLAVLSSDLDYQFAMEIIGDARPHPSGRRHRAALVLFLYVIEHSRQLLYAHYQRTPRSFERMYDIIVRNLEPLPLDPLKDALASLGDRIVYRQYEIKYRREGFFYQFTHPVYLDGVKRAIEDPEVRRLMVLVILALGEEHNCSTCGFDGPFIHSYQFRCNELYREGAACPQCQTWIRLGYVLGGISLPYSLEPVYNMLDMIRYFSVSVGSQIIRISILTSLLQQYNANRLIELTIECINEIFHEPKPTLFMEDLYFVANGTRIDPNILLADIRNDVVDLKSKEMKGASITEISKYIQAGSTDVDW